MINNIDSSVSKNQKKDSLILAFSMLIGATLVIYATSTNLGISPDSAVYIGVARNLMHGNGLVMPMIFEPLTHYPPLFPILLTPAWFLNIDITIWIRVVNVLLFSSSILLIGLISKKIGILRYWIPSLLMATNPALIEIHEFAWTEPLFIFLILLGIYFLKIYLEKNRLIFLLVASFSFSAALMTRYIGVAVVGAFLVFLLFICKKSFFQISLAGFVAVIPFISWVINIMVTTNDPTYRYFAVRPISIDQNIIMAGILIFFIIIFAFSGRHQVNVISFISLTGIFYMIIFTLTVNFFDNTPVDNRLLSPIYTLVFIFIGLLPSKLSSARSKLVTILIIVWIFGQFVFSGAFAMQSHYIGNYLSDGSWSNIVPPHDWRAQ
ncbi:MAG: ArnT family glycosyltransferase [Anaerolineaceae bacterium]